MRIYFWPRPRLRQALAVAVLAAVAFFYWLVEASPERPVSGEMLQALYRGNPGRQAVGLMFNVDWGEEYIPQILQLLAQYDARSTFFISGRWAEKFPDLVKEIAAAGHEVGNHGYAHLHVGRLGKEQIKRDLQKAEAALQPLLGRRMAFYAPPYGEAPKQVIEAAAEAGYQTVLWTIDTVDWQPEQKASAIVAKIKDRLVNGALILMHPTAVTVEALPSLLEYLEEKGYRLLSLSEITAP